MCVQSAIMPKQDIKLASVCLFVCSCLNAGLTAALFNLIFGMHTHIGSDCAIGYMILTFEVIKGHFRSNKFLWQVPLSFLNHILPKGYSQKLILGRLLCYLRILGRLLCYNFASEASKILVYIYILLYMIIVIFFYSKRTVCKSDNLFFLGY